MPSFCLEMEFQLRSKTVSSTRPGNGGVRPENRDALAISHRIGVVRCPLARRKGNGVSYKLLQTRKSQKQRLQHNSASRAALSPHEWDARLLAAAPLVTQHRPIRWFMTMAVHLANGGSRFTRHRSFTHSLFLSSPAARQIGMENGPNFTNGKDLHMVGAYNLLMVQTPANQRYLWLVLLRHHSNRARDSFPPSRLLTHKCWSRPRVPASQ